MNIYIVGTPENEFFDKGVRIRNQASFPIKLCFIYTNEKEDCTYSTIKPGSHITHSSRITDRWKFYSEGRNDPMAFSVDKMGGVIFQGAAFNYNRESHPELLVSEGIV